MHSVCEESVAETTVIGLEGGVCSRFLSNKGFRLCNGLFAKACLVWATYLPSLLVLVYSGLLGPNRKCVLSAAKCSAFRRQMIQLKWKGEHASAFDLAYIAYI